MTRADGLSNGDRAVGGSCAFAIFGLLASTSLRLDQTLPCPPIRLKSIDRADVACRNDCSWKTPDGCRIRTVAERIPAKLRHLIWMDPEWRRQPLMEVTACPQWVQTRSSPNAGASRRGRGVSRGRPHFRDVTAYSSQLLPAPRHPSAPQYQSGPPHP